MTYIAENKLRQKAKQTSVWSKYANLFVDRVQIPRNSRWSDLDSEFEERRRYSHKVGLVVRIHDQQLFKWTASLRVYVV